MFEIKKLPFQDSSENNICFSLGNFSVCLPDFHLFLSIVNLQYLHQFLAIHQIDIIYKKS